MTNTVHNDDRKRKMVTISLSLEELADIDMVASVRKQSRSRTIGETFSRLAKRIRRMHT